MTAAESRLASVTPKKFYIFGQGISFSMSPIIHSAAYKYHQLPHTYTIVQSHDIADFYPILEQDDFGGASVTMPHKVTIRKFCDQVTDHAQRIGAVNTIVLKRGEGGRKSIVGDNTDWSGLLSSIRQKSSILQIQPRVGLVIGAGGASRAALYALYQAGLTDIYLVNRTQERAEQAAADLEPVCTIHVVPTLAALVHEGVRPDIILGTVPADCTKEDDFPPQLFSKERGVCIEMSYKPRVTPLLTVASIYTGWATVTGLEVLLEQAIDQFQIWLGLPAPREEMANALMEPEARTTL
jgi:shikimate-5-dehydrogenase